MRAALTFAFLALAAAPAPASAQDAPAPVPGTATANANVSAVNLRAGPSTADAVLGRIAPGQPATVVGCTEDGTWCRLDVDGTLGWASMAVLTAPPAAAAPAAGASGAAATGARAPVRLPAYGQAVTVANPDGARLRAAPGGGAEVLALLPAGGRATLVGCDALVEWCEVALAGTRGFVDIRAALGATGPVIAPAALGARAPAPAPDATAAAPAEAPTPPAPADGGIATTALDPAPAAPTAEPGAAPAQAAEAAEAPAPRTALVAPATDAPMAEVSNLGGSFVNLRAGPSTTEPVLGRIAPGQRGRAEGCSERGDWCLLDVGGTRGWAYLPVLAAAPAAPAAPARPADPGAVDALTADVRAVLGRPAAAATPAPAPAANPAPAIAAAAAPVPAQAPAPATGGGRAFDNRTDGVINLRAGPGTEHAILGGLAPGEGGSVGPDCAPGADWCQLRLDVGGGRAWVLLSLLTPR